MLRDCDDNEQRDSFIFVNVIILFTMVMTLIIMSYI